MVRDLLPPSLEDFRTLGLHLHDGVVREQRAERSDSELYGLLDGPFHGVALQDGELQSDRDCLRARERVRVDGFPFSGLEEDLTAALAQGGHPGVTLAVECFDARAVFEAEDTREVVRFMFVEQDGLAANGEPRTEDALHRCRFLISNGSTALGLHSTIGRRPEGSPAIHGG